MSRRHAPPPRCRLRNPRGPVPGWADLELLATTVEELGAGVKRNRLDLDIQLQRIAEIQEELNDLSKRLSPLTGNGSSNKVP